MNPIEIEPTNNIDKETPEQKMEENINMKQETLEMGVLVMGQKGTEVLVPQTKENEELRVERNVQVLLDALDTISFDIACPYDEWVLNGHSLRPYIIMEEIDKMFNNKPLAGIGTLEFIRADRNVFTSQIGGYTMQYEINEFN